jgi:D-tyrosyl-tRNA(Tyr) deacylase
VTVEEETVGEIGSGLLALVGVGEGDGAADAEALADKILALRIFPDGEGRMNLSVADAGGEVLVVSQFTLLADVRKGRRPSFAAAAPPDAAEPLVDAVAGRIRGAGIGCSTGRFGARMAIELVNDGPVTMVVDVADGRVA